MGLKLEIKTWGSGTRLQMTRESSLNTIKRLTGETFGKGLKARQEALEWLLEIARDNGIEIDTK
jgi:hypothetical protein